MRNFKNNFRRNRYKNHLDRNHQKNENGSKLINDLQNGSNFIRSNAGRNNYNATKLVEKYSSLAREALTNGDKILSENYFQHAEHFVRVLEEKNNLNSKISISKDIKKNGDELVEEKINQEQENPEPEGYFCLTTSYRDEKNPIYSCNTYT